MAPPPDGVCGEEHHAGRDLSQRGLHPLQGGLLFCGLSALVGALHSALVDVTFCCVQALLNNSYFYHMAHGKDLESRGIECTKTHMSIFYIYMILSMMNDPKQQAENRNIYIFAVLTLFSLNEYFSFFDKSAAHLLFLVS